MDGEEYDSTQIQTITSYSGSDTNPKWSPDGNHIAFTSARDYVRADTLRFRQDLYLFSAEGTNLKRITNTGFARTPIWNSNSNAIIFRVFGSESGIYKINIENQKITKIKNDFNQRIHLVPQSWSKNGNHLLFLAYNLDQPKQTSLFVIDLKDDEMGKIYSGMAISETDWFIPPN